MDKEELVMFLRENLRVELELNDDVMRASKLIVSLKLCEQEFTSEVVELPFEWRKW